MGYEQPWSLRKRPESTSTLWCRLAGRQEWVKNVSGLAWSLVEDTGGAGEGGTEPAKEREATWARGKSQGRKGGGQRKQDLAEAPWSPTRKLPGANP